MMTEKQLLRESIRLLTLIPKPASVCKAGVYLEYTNEIKHALGLCMKIVNSDDKEEMKINFYKLEGHVDYIIKNTK